MDRRAAGALLALAACIACSAAAPTASNHTALDLYEGASEGCYYNFQHYGEGDRIMTNEPCLNCTCHNRMLMCYLRVCPFTKPIGQDCTVEKRADQCCPIVTCPDVPVDLLTSTSTSSPAEYGATGLGKLDKYGCSINGKYFPEGSKVPPTPNKPCEHCYCIRNMTTCVMQECTLHVDGCTPIYHKDVCCPVRYSCDHPEDEVPLLDDMSTTVRPTPGFLLTTTTVSPVTQMTQDCVHNDQIIADGASITTDKACEHCYCMKGDIVCVVQECGAPMENEGKNCTSLPPREGQCCPDTYICEGDELSTEVSTESATDSILEKLTTLSPPRRGGVEGSGYRHEPNEAYTEIPTVESELEGSGEEQESIKPTDEHGANIPEKPEEITPSLEEGDQYIPVSTKAPIFEEATTMEIERNVIQDNDSVKETDEPQLYYPTTQISIEKDVDKFTSVVTESEDLYHEHVTVTDTLVPHKYDKFTTESGESLNTVPDIVPEKEQDKPHEITPGTTIIDEYLPAGPQEMEESKITTSANDQDITLSPILEQTSKPEYYTQSPEVIHEKETETTEESHAVPEEIPDEESLKPASDIGGITKAPTGEEIRTIAPEIPEVVTVSDISEEKDVTKPEQNIPITTITLDEIERLTTEPNHAQNTVDVAEDESYPHVPEESQKTTASDLGDIVTEKVIKEDEIHEPIEQIPFEIPASESKTTVEPDKGLNTIPSETDDESSSQPSLVDRTTSSIEIKSTESPVTVEAVEPQEVDIQSPTAFEPSSTLSETHVTKVDQYTITTEPSFRKEDEISASTEKPKEESASTTIKAEFVDEGLIPTSSHDEKLETGSDISSMDEDMTTMAPEYHKELDETVEINQQTTQSIPETSIDSGSLPEIVVEPTRKPEGSLSPSTEKVVEVTSIPVEESHQEPSRIPGEGDCLLNGVTYKNNTIVPSANNCHTGCKCISSIVKCDPIICSPPPDYMDNCQSIYDSPDSCCPTYVCDHPRETIPPQSDNQMSGTEPPMPPPTIECRGDQCELSEPTKPTAADDKIATQCGSEGCDGIVKEPASPQPSFEHSGCADGKCETSAEGCAYGKCDLPAHIPESTPIKPCVGDDCKMASEEMPAPQLCANGDDCKKPEIPITQIIPNVDCGSNACDSDVNLPSHDSHQGPCKETDGCKPQEIIPSECTGEAPCRRKDSPVAEQSPGDIKCEGSDCEQKTDTVVTENVHQISTESSIPEQTLTESEKHVSGEEKRPEQEIVTEREYVPTKHYTITDIDITTEKVTEKVPEVQVIPTEQPVYVEKDVTKSPEATEEYTGEPIPTEDSFSKQPDTKVDESVDKPAPIEEQGIKMPDVEEEQSTKLPTDEKFENTHDADKEHTDKLAPVDEEATKIPDITEEYIDKTTRIPDDITKHTDKPTLIQESGVNVPVVTDEYIDKSTKMPDVDEPTLTTDLETKISDIIEEHTNEPVVIKDDESKIPNVDGIEYTDKPASVEEQETKIPISIVEVHTERLTPVEDEVTTTPVVAEEYTDKWTKKPDVIKEHIDEPTSIEESGTKVPDFLQEYTTETGFIKEKGTKTPDALGEEYTDKPTIVEKQETQMPDAGDEKATDKITSIEVESTGIPHITHEYSDKETTVSTHTDRPTMIHESDTKIPDTIIDHTDEPATIYEEGTKTPDYGNEYSERQPSIEEQETPDTTDKYIDKLSPVEEEGSKIPEVTEIYEPTKMPDVMMEHTDESTSIDDSKTKIPDLIEDHTKEPTSGVEDGTKTPVTIEEENLNKLPTIEEQTMKTPEDVTDKTYIDKEKPILSEEELPEKPTVVKEADEEKPGKTESDDTTEPATEQEESTENIEIIKDSSTNKPIIIDDGILDEIEGSTDKLPVVTEKTSSTEHQLSTASSMIEQEDTEKPAVFEEDHTSAPVVEEHTSRPDRPEPTVSYQDEHVAQTLDEEGFGTKAPVTHVTESEFSLEEYTKTERELEKVTQTPTYESPTSVGLDGMLTESHVEPVDVSIPEVFAGPGSESSESSDAKGPQSQESGLIIPTESAPEVLTELEKTTEKPVDVTISQDILTHLPEDEKETKQPSDLLPQEPSTSQYEATKMPEIIVTTESVEKITKSTDHGPITEQGEIYTDTPAQEPSDTELPSDVIIEPQEGQPPGSPDLTMIGPTGEESTTKVFDEGHIKPAAPESYITDIGPEYDRTSALPEPEIVRVTEIPKIDDAETHNTPTHIPLDFSEHDVKTDKPDIFTPEKEEMITSAKDIPVTEPAVSSFTEIEDSSVTGEENVSAGYYGETTEKVEPYATEKIDASSVETPSSSEDIKTTKGPEEPYTNTHETTDTPTLMETKPAEIGEADKIETSPILPVQDSTTSKSPDLSQETSESSIPSEEPHRRTETTESDEIATPKLPVSIVTKPEEPIIPIDDLASQEEKTTETPDFINLDASTVSPEVSVTKAPATTEIPEAHITASSTPEQTKVTDSTYAEPHITEAHETEIKSEESDTGIEKTTRTPEIPVKPDETESQSPEVPLPEVYKPSTDYPGTVVEIRTELPHTQVTTEASLSLVTEYQPDIGDTTKEQDYKAPLLPEIEIKPQQETTEKSDLATSMLEVTTAKQAEEFSKPEDQTLAHAEFSETTPYLIILEEHTHKILEDISTMSPVDEKEEEVTSTPVPPSKEEHTIAQDLMIEEEHLSTVSPASEEYTHKLPEDTPAVSSAQPEAGIQSSVAPSEIKPEEIETVTKQVEIPSDESTTVVGVVSDQTTLSVPEEASENVSESYTPTKAVHEETTVVLPVVQDDADQKDVTTSKPIQDFEETSASILTESPTLGSDIEVQTEKEIFAAVTPSHPHIYDASEKTTVPEDELIYSTTKTTTIKEEELLTPSSEDKYSKPEDKPSSEVIPPSSTAEVPKPSAEIEPTEEIPAPEDDGHFPQSATGYGEPDYGEEDQAFGPGTCRYGGKVYVSAQQIPRDDPCDFCFCFRSDIICLQQSCPPPIHGCHEEPIQGFCCPRYECPVSMATTVNVTTTTTTTTTTLPPHFPTHSYKGAAQRRGCQIKGHTYKVGEVVRSASGPCLHCKCGGDGQMKCDPKACTPEPMLRQMIAAAVSAKRRR